MKNKTSKLFIAFSMFGLLLTGCSNLLPNQPNKNSNNAQESQKVDDFEAKTREIYNLYLAQGGTLTYEQWLESIRGTDGKDGKDGKNGADGKNGTDGQTPYIGSNGNWWIGNNDTGVKAEGKDGKDGAQGQTGQNGADGKDGQTPYVGENGNWWIGETDTGVLAKGSNGENGKGIASVSYNGENELIVTFDDGTFVNLGTVNASTHQHTYECETLEATCTTDGYYRFTCSTCGHIETVINKAQGHIFDAYREKVPATCTHEGQKSRKCTVCGYEETMVIPAHDHTYTESCVHDANKHWRYCTACGVVKDEADHIFVDNICTVCSYIKPTSSASTTGLLFGLNDDGASYSLISYGTCTDKEINIPSSYNGNPVTAIASAAFQNTDITSVTMPDTIVQIGSSAFSGCKSLASVSFSNSLKALSEYCFSGCNALTNVVLPNGLEVISNYSFMNCSNLVTIFIPDSVVSVGEAAFYSCKNLDNVVIPNSVKQINYEAFRKCSSIKSIVIPSSVESINTRAFYGCNALTNVVLNKGLRAVYTNAFDDCSIESITIPSTVYYLCSYCFGSSISTAYFEQPDGWYKTNDNENIFKEVLGVPELAANQLKNMSSSWRCKLVADKIEISSSIANVAIGGTVSAGISLSPKTAIDPISYVSQNPDIATVDENGIITGVSAGITTITASVAYLGTTSIEIRVGDPETNNGFAFYKLSETECVVAASGNYSLSGDIVIPSTYNGKRVTKILRGGFSDCYNIKSVYIPASIISIGDRAFNSCYALKQVKFESTVPPQIGYNLFEGIWNNDDFEILVPASSVSAYKEINEYYWHANAISHIVGYEPEN